VVVALRWLVGTRRVRRGARPVHRGHSRQRRALGDQLGLGLPDQGVLVDPERDRPDRRHGGGEQQDREKDGAQAQRRPVAPDERTGPADQGCAWPRQGPRR
jgi:hypothetical protein